MVGSACPPQYRTHSSFYCFGVKSPAGGGLYGFHGAGDGASTSSAILVGILTSPEPAGIIALTCAGNTTWPAASLWARCAVSSAAQSRNATQSRYVTNPDTPMPMIWPVKMDATVLNPFNTTPTKKAHAFPRDAKYHKAKNGEDATANANSTRISPRCTIIPINIQKSAGTRNQRARARAVSRPARSTLSSIKRLSSPLAFGDLVSRTNRSHLAVAAR